MFRRFDEDREQWFAQMAARLPDRAADPDSPLGRMAAMGRGAAGARRRGGTTVRTWAPVTPDEPVAVLPVVQLHAADIPEVRFPVGTDMVQILWCPYRHPDVPGMHEHYSGPALKVIWRAAGSLADTVFPACDAVAGGGFVLEPCVLHPERITEYPDIEDLSESLQSRIDAWEEGLGEGSGYDYRNGLSVAPGLKTGGWPYWPHCPRPVQCGCGSEMSLLLTMPHGEHGAQSWNPLEDRSRAAGRTLPTTSGSPSSRRPWRAVVSQWAVRAGSVLDADLPYGIFAGGSLASDVPLQRVNPSKKNPSDPRLCRAGRCVGVVERGWALRVLDSCWLGMILSGGRRGGAKLLAEPRAAGTGYRPGGGRACGACRGQLISHPPHRASRFRRHSIVHRVGPPRHAVAMRAVPRGAVGTRFRPNAAVRGRGTSAGTRSGARAAGPWSR